MLRSRLIPALLLDNGSLVKTHQFHSPVYVGDPINAVRIFNDKQVDELLVMDIGASHRNQAPDIQLIERIANECFMPLCYVGGVRNEEDVEKIVSLGIEKVGMSTAFVEHPQAVEGASKRVGSQSVVVVLDVERREAPTRLQVLSDRGRIPVDIPFSELCLRAQECGAGEIVVNCVDRDGTGVGYDLDLADELLSIVKVPVTLLGGAGSLNHVRDLYTGRQALGAAAGSLFTFHGKYRSVLLTYPTEEERMQLLQGRLG